MGEQETPNFDSTGAARDKAYGSLGGICEIAAREKPAVGKQVMVIDGKHKGKIGVVFWHGLDRYKYDRSLRYRNDFQAVVSRATGIYGYRVGVQTETEQFFVDADKVKIIEGAK